MIAHVAFIQSEHELVDVAAHVLLAAVVVDAVVTALEYRPNISIPFVWAPPVDVLFGTVLDAMVFVHIPDADIVRLPQLYLGLPPGSLRG